MCRRNSRRRFLARAGLVGVGAWGLSRGLHVESTAGEPSAQSPNERLNVAVIGVGGRGAYNTDWVKRENIVALCDVDDKQLEKAASRVVQADIYNDWREVLERDDIDAVLVSTADHTHAAISVAAMRRGKHVYCEKPLARTVSEARLMRETARKAKVATQMGTQKHACDNFLGVVELIRSATIGAVKEVHVWCGRIGSGGERPTEEPPVPDHIHWDLWLGPAPWRPYHPSYFGGCTAWEQYWDFGNGCLGDMGSHLIDLPFWALELGPPTSVEAEGASRNTETYPQWLIARWEHPATTRRPGLELTWYDGVKRPPSPPGHDLSQWPFGVMFVGERGSLLADYERRVLLPEERFRRLRAPAPTLPRSVNHYKEWLTACRTGAATSCHFDYSGLLIEHNLLGTVAFRTGKRLVWAAEDLKAANCPEADQFLRPPRRKGWEL